MRAVVIKDMFCRGSILCCALLLCCLCLWPAGARALSSDAARACVVEAGGAVDNADAACFEQLVDMDAILNEAVDLFMKEAAKPENSSLLPPMLALMFSGAAMAEDNGLGVRKLLVSEARAFVHNGIASGAFAGKSVQDYRTEGWVAPLFESVSMGRKEIRNVGTPVRQGKDWIVPFVLLRGRQDSAVLAFLSRAMPLGVMIVLVAYTLGGVSLSPSISLPAAAGIGATAGLHLWRRSIGLSLIGGTGIYVIVSLLLG